MRQTRFLLKCVVIVIAVFPCKGRSQTGSAVVTNGAFTNVYVYPDPDKETWEQHLATLPPELRPGADRFSRASIDSFTDQLMSAGWPSYFDPLFQYYQIRPPRFFGSAVATQACVNAHLKRVYKGVLQWDTIKSLANCHVSGHDPSPQVILIFSPDIPIASITGNEITRHGADMCPGTMAYHGWGFNTPNYVAMPTKKACVTDFDSFTQMMSHEIVETLSDPAGAGMGDFPNYTHELGDNCSQVLTTFRGFSVQRYWSMFDGNCQPRLDPPAGSVAETWVFGEASPLKRFSGDAQLTLDVPVARVTSDARATQVQLVIQTGEEEPPVDGNQADDAVATLHFVGGSIALDITSSIQISCITTPSSSPIPPGSNPTIQPARCINSGPFWQNGETHALQFTLPSPAPRVSEITGVTISSHFKAGTALRAGFHWNVDKVALVVSFPAGSATRAPPKRTLQHTWLDASGAPLVRFTGDVHDTTLSTDFREQDVEATVVALDLIISTGNDDLRGGSSPGDNCDVTVVLASGQTIQINNVNGGQTWSGWSIHTVSIPVSPGIRPGDVKAISLHTGFGGGISGDNWNVNRVQLKATLANPPPRVTGVSPNSVKCGVSTPTTVIIGGANFFDVQTVTLEQLLRDLYDLGFTVNSSTQITATIPNSVGLGYYDVTVRTLEGVSGAPLVDPSRPNLFSVTPIIDSIEPKTGPATGGTKVTVYGTCVNLPIFFGNRAVVNREPSTSTTRAVVVSPPSDVAQTVDVVTRMGASSPTTPRDRFTYNITPPTISVISPQTGPVTGGTYVSLIGWGFPDYPSTSGTSIQVSFGGVPARVAGCGFAGCSVVAPLVKQPGPVHVKAIASVAGPFGGSSKPSPADVFTYNQYPALTRLQLPDTSIGVGSATVFLDGNAPAGGALITLSSSDGGVVAVPANVTIPLGSQSASFPVTFLAPRTQSVTLTATYQNSSVNAGINAWPPIAIVTGDDTPAIGQSIDATVIINSFAPTGGAVVSLSSSDPAAISLPSSVTIFAGSYAAPFTIVNRYSGRSKGVTVSATYKGASASLGLFVPFPTKVPRPRRCPSGYFWNPSDSQCESGLPK